MVTVYVIPSSPVSGGNASLRLIIRLTLLPTLTRILPLTRPSYCQSPKFLWAPTQAFSLPSRSENANHVVIINLVHKFWTCVTNITGTCYLEVQILTTFQLGYVIFLTELVTCTGIIAFSLCLDLCCQNGLGYMSSGEAVLNEYLLQEFYIRSHTHLSSSEI